MSAAGSSISGEDIWQSKVNPWITAVAVSLAAFMEVLDTSIANVALPHGRWKLRQALMDHARSPSNAPSLLRATLRCISQDRLTCTPCG
jgi:hypothetical protein